MPKVRSPSQFYFMSDEKGNSRVFTESRVRSNRGRWSDNDLLLFVQSLLNSIDTEENLQTNIKVMKELLETIKDFRECKPNWYFVLEKIPGSNRKTAGNE